MRCVFGVTNKRLKFLRVSVIKCNTKEKTQFISNKHRSSSNYDNSSDPWLVNLTKIEIPKNVHFLQIRRLKL